MQVRIKKVELEAFKTQASLIRANTSINPILTFIKFEVKGDDCTITKSSGESFVIRTIPVESEDCSFLVDEKILFNFMEFCSSEYFEFSKEGNRIKITGGKEVTRSGTEEASGFLLIKEPVMSEWVLIPRLVLDSCGIASNFIFDNEVKSRTSCVFVGKEAVIGCDGNIAYYQKIGGEVPQMVLRKEVAVCMSKLSICEYNYNLSYDFFKDGNTVFGFIKNEIPFNNLNMLFPVFDKVSDFSFHKSFFVKFNSYCANTRTDKTCACTFNCQDDYIKLELIDAKNEFDAKTEFYIKGCNGYFKFNPEYMNNLLKAIPVDDCVFYRGDKRYYITDATKSFMAAIMEIA